MTNEGIIKNGGLYQFSCWRDNITQIDKNALLYNMKVGHLKSKTAKRTKVKNTKNTNQEKSPNFLSE